MRHTSFYLLLAPIVLIGIFVFHFGVFDKKENPQTAITVCGPLTDMTTRTAANGKYISPLPGWGNYAYPISAKNDSVQFYFNQGLTMYYSYHMKEALASFQEATRLEPENAMTYWGQALAMGPYYNSAHLYTRPQAIPDVLNQMHAFASKANSKEQRLISVMNQRYSMDASDADRKALNVTYAKETHDLISEFPEDRDIKMLYVDAVMLIHAWDFWNNDGTPKAWTNEVIALCENVLKENPNHPAALHYHIHLTEASRNPEVALPNADKLRDQLPGVPHMVHMSSHEYERNGFFLKGVDVNNRADAALLKYDSLAKNLSLVKHSPHYFAVQTYCAMSAGLFKTGMNAAIRLRKSVAPVYENPYDQYLFMLPELTLVRLGKWQEILSDTTKLDPKWTYAMLLRNFARGIAYVNTGSADKAKAELSSLLEKSKDPILTKRRIPFNSFTPIANIAGEILTAAIAFDNKNYDQTIASLNKAVEIEDGLIYTEPNDWPIPARQFLGAYLLKMGKPAVAEKVYREDLMWNPGNGWSAIGLFQSLKAQKRTKELAKLETGYKQSFSAAERIPSGSVFLR
jgi:tetratricopeptide (TPR) repeat protein